MVYQTLKSSRLFVTQETGWGQLQRGQGRCQGEEAQNLQFDGQQGADCVSLVEPSFQHCLLGLLLELNLVGLNTRSHPKASKDLPS